MTGRVTCRGGMRPRLITSAAEPKVPSPRKDCDQSVISLGECKQVRHRLLNPPPPVRDQMLQSMPMEARTPRQLVLDQVVDHVLAAHPGDRALAWGRRHHGGQAEDHLGGRACRGHPGGPGSSRPSPQPRRAGASPQAGMPAGRTSPGGCSADAYDVVALAEKVLRPLGAGGDRRIRPRVADLASGPGPFRRAPAVIPMDAVVWLMGVAAAIRAHGGGTRWSTSRPTCRCPIPGPERDRRPVRQSGGGGGDVRAAVPPGLRVVRRRGRTR